MGPDIGHPEEMAFPAKAGSAGLFMGKPIDPAIPWTQAAVFKKVYKVHVRFSLEPSLFLPYILFNSKRNRYEIPKETCYEPIRDTPHRYGDEGV